MYTFFNNSEAGDKKNELETLQNTEDIGKTMPEAENHGENDTDEDVLSPNNKKLKNYSELFKWYNGKLPEINEYDSNSQKSRKYLAYGVSEDEYEHMKKCYDKDVAYNTEHPLDDIHSGHGKYSLDRLILPVEKFDRKYMSSLTSFSNANFSTTMSPETKDKYFTEGGRDLIINNLNDDRTKINNLYIYDTETNRLCENQTIYYVTIDVDHLVNSPWVQDVLIAPKLTYMKNEGDMLTEIDDPAYISINNQILSNIQYGIYIINGNVDNDFSFYDYEDKDCVNSVPQCHCPLRNGEFINARIVYMIPAQYIENAYLVYNDLEEFQKVDYTYNLRDTAILELYREYKQFRIIK